MKNCCRFGPNPGYPLIVVGPGLAVFDRYPSRDLDAMRALADLPPLGLPRGISKDVDPGDYVVGR